MEKYHGDLKRVNYGIRFTDHNASGRKDEVRVNVLSGYSTNISLSYNNPYSNAALTHGNSVDAGYNQLREVPYKTSFNNNYVYFKSKDFVYDSWHIQASYSVRKAIKKTERYNIGFTHIKLADSIITRDFNPKYFNSTSSEKNLIDLSYNYRYRDVNNILYPLQGYIVNVNLSKRGFGFTGGANMFSIEAVYNKFIALHKKWYFDYQLMGKIKLPFKQPYINQSALGLGQTYIRGLELYVIDAAAYSIGKFTLRKQILNFKIPTGIRSEIYNKLPFKFYAKTFADVGYAYNKDEPATRLNNKLLYSAGFGVDIVTLYDIQLRLEYSFNQLGQNNLFLHSR